MVFGDGAFQGAITLNGWAQISSDCVLNSRGDFDAQQDTRGTSAQRRLGEDAAGGSLCTPGREASGETRPGGALTLDPQPSEQ